MKSFYTRLFISITIYGNYLLYFHANRLLEQRWNSLFNVYTSLQRAWLFVGMLNFRKVQYDSRHMWLK